MRPFASVAGVGWDPSEIAKPSCVYNMLWGSCAGNVSRSGKDLYRRENNQAMKAEVQRLHIHLGFPGLVLTSTFKLTSLANH